MSRFTLPDRYRKNVLPLVLMAVGLVLLLYVAVEYGTMYAEQRRLANEWQQQNAEQTSPAAEQAVNDGLIKVTIPKIKLDAIVVEGTGRRELLLGPGHMPDTPAPGEAGNSVITGHRDTFFRHIYELNKGDNIEVRRNGRMFTYEVTGKRVVQPDDMSVIQPSKDKRLTLITCYPTYYIGPAPERLVVFARMVEKPAEAKVVEARGSSQ